jgi:hypothetical protein
MIKDVSSSSVEACEEDIADGIGEDIEGIPWGTWRRTSRGRLLQPRTPHDRFRLKLGNQWGMGGPDRNFAAI